MKFEDIPVPEIYTTSADFRFFLRWFNLALSKIQYDTENLADLYDPISMPSDLHDAHKALDKAVKELYGYSSEMSEPEIVADLMVRYQKLVEAEKAKEIAEKSAKPKRTRGKKSGVEE